MTAIVAAAVVATNLPTVVVEASRLDRGPLEIASAVRVVDADEISSSAAHDAVDLLAKKAPELHLRHLGAGNPALAEISLRGYGENGHGRTLVLVDGERLNSPDLNMPNLSRIALGGVSKIEILGGPQTVLQGDGASAGVINVLTEPQDDERRSYAEVHGGSWGSVGTALGTRGGFAEEGVRYWADGAWDHSDGYRDHSGYDLWNLGGGLRKTWESGTWLRVSGFYNDARYDLPGALTYREWKDDPRQSHASVDKFHRETYGFNTTFNAELDEENALKVTGTFSSRKLWGYQQGADWFSDNEYDIYSYRLLTEWINTSAVFGFDNELVAGAQYQGDLLGGTQKSSYTVQRPDYDRQAMDYYAQDTFRLLEGLSVQPGARYSRVWSHNSLCERSRRTDDLAAFDLGVVCNPTDRSKLYVRESRFYRNPFLDEVPGRFDAGYNWVNTEILSPETGWTSEVGAAWDMTDELSVGMDAYATWLKDEIFYNAIGGNNENCRDTTFRRGVDAHVSWEKDKFAGLSVAASYVKATFDDGDFGHNRIPLVPETTVTAGGRVWLWDDCTLFGGCRCQTDMCSCSDFANDFRKIGGFCVFYIGAGYEPTFVPFLEGMKFTVTVDNLFDKEYCDYATYGTQYYPAAGRSVTLGARYAF